LLCSFGSYAFILAYQVEERWPGIYYIQGDILPIQILDSRALPPDENLWLTSLTSDLEIAPAIAILEETRKRSKDVAVVAYLRALFDANPQTFLEVGKMQNETLTFDDVLVELGLTAKWKNEKSLEIAQKALEEGATVEFVSKITGLDIETVKDLYPK
jgi:hypothetical protein